MPKTIDHLTYDDTIRKPWTIRHPSCDRSGQCNQGRCPFGGHCPAGAVDTEPGDLEDTKRETESAALFVAGLILVVLCACLGLWLSFVVGG